MMIKYDNNDLIVWQVKKNLTNRIVKIKLNVFSYICQNSS